MATEQSNELKNILSKYNKRYTHERELIYKKVLEQESEFTASDIICSLDNDIACRSVYHNLSAFCEMNIIHKVPSTERESLYKLI